MTWNDIKTGSSTVTYIEWNDMTSYIIGTGSEVDLATGSLINLDSEIDIHTGSLLDLDVEIGSKLSNLSEDLTPQLGGELSCGSNTINFAEQIYTGSGTVNLDWTNSNKVFVNLTNTTIFTFTAPSGAANLNLVLKQDAVGGRTVTWPNTIIWSAATAPTLSTTGNKIDLVALYYSPYIGSYLGVSNTNF